MIVLGRTGDGRGAVSVSDPQPGGRVVFGALMPHAPILIPGVGGRRQNDAITTISAMQETARAIIAATADTLIVNFSALARHF